MFVATLAAILVAITTGAFVSLAVFVLDRREKLQLW